MDWSRKRSTLQHLNWHWDKSKLLEVKTSKNESLAGIETKNWFNGNIYISYNLEILRKALYLNLTESLAGCVLQWWPHQHLLYHMLFLKGHMTFLHWEHMFLFPVFDYEPNLVKIFLTNRMWQKWSMFLPRLGHEHNEVSACFFFFFLFKTHIVRLLLPW